MHYVLTKSNMFIVSYIALVLGLVMNGIFYVISGIGIPNVGLAIILFTIIMYIAMTPLTVKQQRFSRMNAVMQPEIQKIQAKYKGKQDQISQQRMMDETQAVYKKYGVSASGSCVQLLIQMPVLFALYQVIYHIPGYITDIGTRLTTVIGETGFTEFLSNFVVNANNATLTQTLTADPQTANFVDVIYKLNTVQWNDLLSQASGRSFESALTSVHAYVSEVTTFLGLNISDSPLNMLSTGWHDKAYGLIIAAIAVPVLAWLTQVLNIKLMPQPESSNNENSQMNNSMKMMNRTMPLMSLVFCFTVPTGLGIYWIAGAVVRTIQQLIINAMLKKENLEELIKKNVEKAQKKEEKKGSTNAQISRNTSVNTRSIESAAAQNSKRAALEERLKNLEGEESLKAAPGSLASKANLVADYESRTGQTRKHSDAKKK